MQKNFADFQNVLEEENFLDSVSEVINKALADTSNSVLTRNNLGTVIGIVSNNMALELLARYHQWLTDNGLLKDPSE